MRWSFFLAVVAASGLVSCGSPADSYCSQVAECTEKECDFSQETCQAMGDAELEVCLANSEANLNAIRSGDSAICDECAEAYEVVFACLGDLSSCAALDDAYASCQSEYDDLFNRCEDVEQDCLQ